MMKPLSAAVLACLLLAVACEQAPTDVMEPDGPAAFKKGGGGGGGRGGGGDAKPEIAFTRDYKELWVMDADGSNATRIVVPDQFDAPPRWVGRNPSWSPRQDENGYSVVFNVAGWRVGIVKVWVDANGTVMAGSPADLDTGTEYAGDAAFSPDGNWIAFTGALDDFSCPQTGYAFPFRSLYLIPADGSATPVPVELYCSHASYGLSSPTWSPDGRAIAFTEIFDDEYAIRICNLPGSLDSCVITTAVEPTEADHLGGSDWSNDGTTLAFDWRQDKGWSVPRWSVYTVPLELNGQLWVRGEGSIQPLFSSRGQSWSPDDSRMAADGIFIYDVATLAKKKAAKGSSPDWRGPPPSP